MNYKTAIDSLNVTTNEKYQPKNNETFCNIFAQDVMCNMNTQLPPGTCETMLSHLCGNKFYNWRSVDVKTAQARANKGISTIGITHDHVVVIYPHGECATCNSEVYISMAGYKCFHDTKMTYAYPNTDKVIIHYYSWYN